MSATELNHLQAALGGLLRTQDNVWRDRILALWDDPSIPATVRDALMPALRWDQGAASAAILAGYAAQVAGPLGGFDTSVPYRAMVALNERRDPAALQSLNDILSSDLGATAQAARFLAKRHDENAVAWLAERATQGQMVRQAIDSLAHSRLPAALDALTAVMWRADTSANDLEYTFNYLNYLRQPAALVLRRELALGIPNGQPTAQLSTQQPAALNPEALDDQTRVPTRIRIAALNNLNHRDANDRAAMQQLIDDGNVEVRQAAREQMRWKFSITIPGCASWPVNAPWTATLTLSTTSRASFHTPKTKKQRRPKPYSLISPSTRIARPVGPPAYPQPHKHQS